MAFDFAAIENTAINQTVKSVESLPAASPRAAGWASANPDQALALLFVAPTDNGMIEEVLAA